MSPKRGYGSGSIRERRPGVYEVRAGGRSKTIHGGKKLAERELAKLVAHVGTQRAVDTSRTLGELIDARLATTTLATRTRAAHESVLKQLPDNWRKKKAHSLTVADFDRLYAELHRNGVGVPTIRRLHAVLSGACNDGLRWRWLDHHPARGARIPKQQRDHSSAPDADTLNRVVRVVETDVQLAAWLRVHLATGARRSEILALRWADVDIERRTMRIAHALDADRTLKDTKTRQVRTLALDTNTVAMLATWRDAQEDAAAEAGATIKATSYVFSMEPAADIPWRPEDASRRFKRLCARADPPVVGVTLHDLRHAAATRQINAGVDIVTVGRRLGHTQPATTLNVYSHLIDGADRSAADLMGELLDN